MKKYIIAYTGRRDSGKTTTLALLHNMLAEALPHLDKKQHALPCPDFCSHFLTKGYNICICSGGDSEAAIQAGLAFFEEHKGELLLIATRTRGQSVAAIREYAAQQEAELLWHHAAYAAPANHSHANSEQAAQLFRAISATLKIQI